MKLLKDIQKIILIFSFIFTVSSGLLLAQEELLVKRQTVFEFAKEPTITKKEDQFYIEFETKSFCDVTVSIEDENGDIVRHLASGVLGKRVSPSFQANSLKQSVGWDGKNDRGEYIKDFNTVVVRVSLGLTPMFDKNLYWEPKRRQGREAPIMQATPEGVYVYDGGTAIDFVKLYNHNGDYIKTVYPFPGDKIKDVKGLNQHTFPDGKTLPQKPTYLRQTFLTSGNDYGYSNRKKYAVEGLPSAFGSAHYGMEGYASSILAVNNGKIALGMKYLFRFATDGTSGGMEVEGPAVALFDTDRNKKVSAIVPRSACLSPDGKTLYLTAYHFCRYGKASADIILSGDWHTYHCVLKMDLAGEKSPELFVGSLELDKYGSDDKSLFVPTNVTVDKEGRVYVSDYMNDRVQIFSPEGKLLKSLAVTSPSQVSIHAKTQEIFVFSSIVYTDGRGGGIKRKTPFKSGITVFEEFSKAGKKYEVPFPKEFTNYRESDWYLGGMGFPICGIVTTDGTETNIWLSMELIAANVMSTGKGAGDIPSSNIKVYTLKDKTLVEKADFEKEVTKKNINVFPATYNRQRLYVNPKNQKLYISECRYNYIGKAFKDIREIDPITGAIRKIEIPFDAEDMCFDQKGFAYLRTLSTVVRYDISTNPWTEVPWDYGMENPKVHTDTGSARKESTAISAIELHGGGDWHTGGMFVNSKGHIAVGLVTARTAESNAIGKGFKPVMYPGRSIGGRGGNVAISVYDQFGKVINEDFIPGLANNSYGVGLDNSGNLYLMSSGTRIYDNKPYYLRESGSMMKFKPNKGKIISVGSGDIPITLPNANFLKEPFDIADPSYGNAWVTGAEWMFGGVGFSGKNAGVGCSCWNARMGFDYFNRSFAPEIDRYSVAVLDDEGNLILRIGQYGNGDSQGPKSIAPLGGDEVGLVHGAYLATLTDKFVFIADPASQRIVSVKLDYAKSHKQKLPIEK